MVGLLFGFMSQLFVMISLMAGWICGGIAGRTADNMTGEKNLEK